MNAVVTQIKQRVSLYGIFLEHTIPNNALYFRKNDTKILIRNRTKFIICKIISGEHLIYIQLLTTNRKLDL